MFCIALYNVGDNRVLNSTAQNMACLAALDSSMPERCDILVIDPTKLAEMLLFSLDNYARWCQETF